MKGTALVVLLACAWVATSCGGRTYDAGTRDSGTLATEQVSPTTTSSATSSASTGAISTVAISGATRSGTGRRGDLRAAQSPPLSGTDASADAEHPIRTLLPQPLPSRRWPKGRAVSTYPERAKRAIWGRSPARRPLEGDRGRTGGAQAAREDGFG